MHSYGGLFVWVVLRSRSQLVMVDDCRSKLVNVVRSAAGQCFELLIVTPPYLGTFFSILENMLVGSTLMAVVPSPGVRVAVAESVIRELGTVSE